MIMNSSSHRCVILAAFSALSTGCYAYLPPPQTAQPLVGAEVQATLSDSGAVVLASKVGPQVDQLRGRVISEQPGTLTLAMDEAVQRDGNGVAWKHESLEVPRPLIEKVEVRQFSPSRTALWGGLFAVAMITIERGFLHSGGANAPGSTQTGTPGAK